jgi:hypothetical protein
LDGPHALLVPPTAFGEGYVVETDLLADEVSFGGAACNGRRPQAHALLRKRLLARNTEDGLWELGNVTAATGHAYLRTVPPKRLTRIASVFPASELAITRRPSTPGFDPRVGHRAREGTMGPEGDARRTMIASPLAG